MLKSVYLLGIQTTLPYFLPQRTFECYSSATLLTDTLIDWRLHSAPKDHAKHFPRSERGREPCHAAGQQWSASNLPAARSPLDSFYEEANCSKQILLMLSKNIYQDQESIFSCLWPHNLVIASWPLLPSWGSQLSLLWAQPAVSAKINSDHTVVRSFYFPTLQQDRGKPAPWHRTEQHNSQQVPFTTKSNSYH